MAARKAKAGRTRAATEARIARFVEAFITCDNAAEAARQAGYDAKQAALWGHRLLKKPAVAGRIDTRRKELQVQFEVTTERTIDTLASMMFFDPIELFDDNGALRDINAVPKRTRQALAGFKVRRIAGKKGEPDEEIVEVKFVDRGASIEKGMRHLGLFDKDNNQKRDAVKELLEHVAAAGRGLAVQPR